MATPNMKPFKLYYKPSPGPNPWKVVIILEELELPYEFVETSYEDVKLEPYISLNPNGRLPALIDPNTDITLWESGAIIDYLIAEYDPENLLQYTTLEKHITRCWEHFQMSGQGPYFGQLAWFAFLHPERVQSAIDRYSREAERVTGVIDAHLAKKGTPYLVGDKCTYADLMFVPYFHSASIMCSEYINFDRFEMYNAWINRLYERPAVAKVVADIKMEISKHGLKDEAQGGEK